MRRSAASRERGATLVEFAVVIPLLLLLLFAIVEFGRLGFSYAEVWTAAREGARHATTIGDNNGDGVPNFVDCDDIEAHALEKVTMQAISNSDIVVTYLDAGGAPIAACGASTGLPEPTTAGNIDPGTQIQVSIAREYEAIVPLVGQFIDGVPLDSTQIRSLHYGSSS